MPSSSRRVGVAEGTAATDVTESLGRGKRARVLAAPVAERPPHAHLVDLVHLQALQLDACANTSFRKNANAVELAPVRQHSVVTRQPTRAEDTTRSGDRRLQDLTPIEDLGNVGSGGFAGQARIVFGRRGRCIGEHGDA